MAVVYPVLYLLENSIREVIDRVMISRYGDNWWDSEAPKGLRDTVSGRMADEKKNCWHQRRGDRPIDYLDLNQLTTLMRKVEKLVVPDIIPSLEWFTQLVDEVYKSRCVVCHMNPLDKDNVQAVSLRFTHWQKQINAKKHLILD
jgi:predicted restriction endonuclease